MYVQQHPTGHVRDYHDNIAKGGKNSTDWKGPDKWYRFVGAAGTQMPINAPGYKQCGTYGAGWLRGRHPSRVGEMITQAEVCFDRGSDGDCRYSTTIKIKRCNGFFIYYLSTPPYSTWLRYCGTNITQQQRTNLVELQNKIESLDPNMNDFGM